MNHSIGPAAARASLAIACVIFTVVYLANCWIGDDAFISYRVSENIINGYGPRWNVAERVQVFTNPLWTFLMAAAAFVTGEFFYTAVVLSLALCLLMLSRVWRWLGRNSDGWLALALLVSSKAFIDYSSSGLEYPLTYLFLALFVMRFLGQLGDRGRPDADSLPALVFIASLGFVNRQDMILLYLPALTWLLLRRVRLLDRRQWLRLIVAASPAWGWLLFALVYYGFPFPNTYYAKAQSGMPHWLQLRQGFAYLASSVRFDIISLATVAAGALIAVAIGGARARLVAAGACLYVFYTVWVGGDFMAGRFFAAPFLVSALLLASLPKKRMTALTATALLVAWNVINPIAPVKSAHLLEMGWPWRLQNGVKDDRGATIGGSSPLIYEVFKRLPDNAMAREARSFRASPERVLVHPWIGEIGFISGPSKFIIDPNGLSDPLLARLPIPPSFYFEFWVSHFTRELPAGYVESRKAGQNLIQDPLIRDYYDKLLRVTTGPIFSMRRLRDIWALNWTLRNFKDQIKAQQRLDAVVRVMNPLIWTHAGAIDDDARVLRATGAEGYLMIGPGTPIGPGRYRVRWIGTTPRADKANLGWVEVCHRDCTVQLARASIAGEGDTLGQVGFAVTNEIRDVEFRMYVYEGSGIVLSGAHVVQER